VNVVNLLLTPVYTAFLSPTDYGNIGLLLLFSPLAKIGFRMGLESGFLRVYYDLDATQQPRFVSSVALFSAASSSLLFALVVSVRAPLALWLLGDPGRGDWIVLSAADVYLGAFSFVPQRLLQIQSRPGLFSSFAIFRHATNAALKVTFLVQGRGVTGVLWSDALTTALFAVVLAPTLLREARWGWERKALARALDFGLPKVPHGLLLQVQNMADRRILAGFVERAQVGQGIKFALSAFEPAWQPFVYAQIGRPEAPRTLARIVTYVWAGFVGAALPLAIFGRELLMLLTWRNHAFWAAAPVVPVVVLAYALQGAFLLGSIGIGIEKKARYYPLITAVTASLNVAANLALIPRYGMLGAAWATVIAYLVMASLGTWISHRLYPIPLEAGRLAAISLAALGCWSLSLLAPQASLAALAVKTAAMLGFPALLLALRVPTAEEWSWLRKRLRREPAGANSGV